MKATDFELEDQWGKKHRLSNYLGQWIVVYFYPKDDTPGCSKEACGFRNQMKNFQEKKIIVLGISADPIVSHRKFSEKFNLNFPLLSDPEKKVIKAYGAWGRKKIMSRELEGILRMTFLINPKGEIVKVYDKVNPEVHAEEILNDIQKLS